ncbi:PLP-dependent transferase [Devosia neptuniae]|jgi:O-acetylhomoserine (thiol)-lyase|uniref:PLP-dependent transferase n=1 Tax=Devosia neptuniae TaxID=191302 RepID=A0ABY6CDA2_9HYPH|nr:PLP-dependent transferase [Devosia neptuniae]UXN68951.1 PLP-dependent transferase [Devosia neptuniae]
MAVTSKHPETQGLHAGWRSDPATGSVAVPIYQTTSFQFEDSEHAADLFSLKKLGNIYTRLGNPTTDVLEKRVAALEGGVAALAVASGQAASAYAVQNLAVSGDNIVASTDLYGGTYNLFKNVFREAGIEVRFVDPSDPENFRRATDDKTRAYYAETLPNPKLAVLPIAEVAAIGRPLGIPLIVDNTAAPLTARPFEHGAAVVVYSSTKYLGGHGTSIGGVIVDGGNFDWAAHPARQPLLNTPDQAYHGAVWVEAAKPLGPIAYILKARTTLLRTHGAALSPFNAFLTIQGLETLALRVDRHFENALKVAKWLSERPEVTLVNHPSLQTGPKRQNADKYLTRGYGALIGFELANGRAAGARFVDSLQLLYHAANIGDARSLAIHPATTTHSQLSPEEQLSAGVTPGHVRLSIGIEHIDDILADLDQALRAAGEQSVAAE